MRTLIKFAAILCVIAALTAFSAAAGEYEGFEPAVYQYDASALYVNDDFENRTVGMSGSSGDGKITVNPEAGEYAVDYVQKNSGSAQTVICEDENGKYAQISQNMAIYPVYERALDGDSLTVAFDVKFDITELDDLRASTSTRSHSSPDEI